MPETGIHGGPHLIVVRVGMADGRENAPAGQLFSELQRPGQLRRGVSVSTF